jgi:hypothetical protein
VADQADGESTQAFWLYERARLGLLRVLAWADRGLGKPYLAKDATAEAALLAEKAQGDFRAIFDRIAEGAKGPYRADGEVY